MKSKHDCGNCIHKIELMSLAGNGHEFDCDLGHTPREGCWFYEHPTSQPMFEQHEKLENVKLKRKTYVKDNDV